MLTNSELPASGPFTSLTIIIQVFDRFSQVYRLSSFVEFIIILPQLHVMFPCSPSNWCIALQNSTTKQNLKCQSGAAWRLEITSWNLTCDFLSGHSGSVVKIDLWGCLKLPVTGHVVDTVSWLVRQSVLLKPHVTDDVMMSSSRLVEVQLPQFTVHLRRRPADSNLSKPTEQFQKLSWFNNNSFSF